MKRRSYSRAGKEPPRFKHPFLSRCLGIPVSVAKVQSQYEIVDLNNRGFPHLRVEWREDNVCPFCAFTNTSTKHIIKHLRRFHGDHHSFVVSNETKGIIRVFCTPTQAYREQSEAEAFSSWPQQQPTCQYEDFVFVRVRSHTDRRTRRRQPVKPWLPTSRSNAKQDRGVAHVHDEWSVPAHIRTVAAAAAARGHPPPPFRPRIQYYHSRSRLPMRDGDCNDDSDDESDNGWNNRFSDGGLQDFTDVTDREKLVMILWNQFSRSGINASDESTPGRAMEFIRLYAHELKNVREELLLMLILFCDHCLISPNHILMCMELYDLLLNDQQLPTD